MVLGPAAYAAAFAVPLIIAWVLTPVMLKLAIRLQVLDAPGERKAQKSAVPYLGGVAIVLAFSATVLLAALFVDPPSGVPALVAVLVTGVLLGLMGLIDDLRGLPPLLRLAFEIAAGVVVFLTEPTLFLPGPFWLTGVVTVAWVVLITNALNLLDNMDGLSAGVATIAGLSFCLIAGVNGQYLVAALSAAVAGCAAGFLRHNFHPAKIYMGDAGSLFLGFMLAVLGIRLKLEDASRAVALFVPVLVLGVALFDTTLVIINRLRHGRSPMLGGRDHTSHRLVWVGIPVPASVGIIYGAAGSLGFLGFLLARLDLVSGMLLTSYLIVAAAGLLVLLSAVPVYDNSRRRQVMLQVVRQHEPEPPAGAGSEPAEPLNGLG